VKGADPTPLYQFLTAPETDSKFAGEIKWNFTKFLVGKDGTILNRFESKVTPDDPHVIAAVEQALH
jgi:glutathione peroxidase